MHATSQPSADALQVVLPVRSQEKGDAAVRQIEKANSGTDGTGSITLMHADLASLASVRQLAAGFKAKYTKLNILVNNAGMAHPTLAAPCHALTMLAPLYDS